MVAYTQNELASVAETSKKFEEYERIAEAMELREDMRTYEGIQKRLNNKNTKLLNGNDVLAKHGLSLNV